MKMRDRITGLLFVAEVLIVLLPVAIAVFLISGAVSICVLLAAAMLVIAVGLANIMRR